MPGVRLDFLPQMADMHVQAFLVPVIVRAPDSLANGIIGYDVPAVIGQPLQQGALGGGQGQRCAVSAADGGVLHPAGYLHLTAQENLEIVADLKGVPHKDIGRVLDIVHLTQDRNRRVGQYSLGMKQRLGIAMALLGSPKLLILDEPTNGLDPAGIQEMRALIRNMPAATGATVLISSHLLGEMEQMVEQVGIIDHGHILFEGPLTELQRHSRGNVTLRLLDPAKAAPILRANGLTAHSDSCVVTLPPLQDALLADLVQKLAACGAGVVELTPHTKTLEEIFLSLTSEEAD